MKKLIETIVMVFLLVMGISLLFYPLDTYLPAGIIDFLPEIFIIYPPIYLVQKHWWIMILIVPIGSLIYIIKEW